MTRGLVLALVLVLAGCAAPAALPAVRFASAPPVRVVDDRRDVPSPPAPRRIALLLYHFDGTFFRRIARALELPRPRRALGVNALDEVPDSTWFTNRIGVREVSLAELRAGPAVVGSPEPHKPWTILSTKVGGKTIGFIMVDARGERFLLKFDRAGFPELETAADVITGKLLWAIGYNVPEDHIVHFRPEELVLAPDAEIKDVFGNVRRLTRAHLDGELAKVVIAPDGRIRGLVSHFLAGKPLGGHPGEGVRGDDPNDRISHELRRDLRGTYAIFAWLDHGDIKEDNSLDMWVADPADPSRHHVKHYLVDFGLSLGTMATLARDRRRSLEYKVDFASMVPPLVSLGLWRRPWENRSAPDLRGVGLFEADTYAPGAWHPMTPAYVPFLTADRFDHFWGAKLLIRFTRAQIRAVVETAQLSDPRAVDYLTDTLVARQRATAHHWFARVSPLDRFEVIVAGGGHALCFDDLTLTYHLALAGTATRYVIASHDRDGRPIGARRAVRASASGRTCTPPLELSSGGDGYTMVRIDTRRPGVDAGIVVHLARAPGDGSPGIIGLWRL